MKRRLPVLLTIFAIAGWGTYFLIRRTEPAELAPIRAAVPIAELEPALARRLASLFEELTADSDSAVGWGTLGMVLEVHDLREASVLAYRRAEALAPKDARWPYLLGHVERIAAPEASRASLLRAVALAPDFPPALRHAGEGAILAGDLDNAARCFVRLAAVAPEIPHGPLGRARVALARDDLPLAIEQGEIALAIAPLAIDVHRMLAEAYRRAGDDERAASHLAAAETGVPMPVADPWRDALGLVHGVTIHWRRERAAFHRSVGLPERAVAEWREALRDDPGSAELSRELAAALADIGRHAEAEALLRECTLRDPADARSRLALGNLVAARGDTPGAIALLEEALRLEPDLHEARGTLGGILVGEGRADEGIAALEATAQGLPDRAEAAFNLGMAYRAVGRVEGAVRELARACALDPEFLRARFELGVTYARMERYDEAAEQFRSVVALDPGRVGAHRNLARALLGAGQSREALAAIRAALARFPEERGLALQEAWTLAVAADDGVRDLARASAIADTLANELTGYDPDWATLRAAIDAAEGNYDAAIAAIDTVLADTDDPELRARRLEQRAAYAAGKPWRE